jgi:spermidine/putrescine transport system substrate-binding protein
MKKVISAILIAIIMMSGGMLSFTGCNANSDALNVFNWGEYIDMSTIRLFEAEYGIKVNYTTYATNEEMYSKLKNSGANYDIIIPSDYMIGRLISENMLEKLDFGNIPNFSYIMEDYINPRFDPYNEYSVPYTWGTVVIIYNSEHVSEPQDGWSWDILWDERYSGKTIMFDNSRDAFGISLKRLGYSLNTSDERELRHAADELKIQRELVQGYFMDEIFNKMGSGEAWIAPYYAGDALYMLEDNPNLAAAYPKEGTNMFIDSICIPKGARNKEAAEKFINFMIRPDIAAQNAEYIGYATPNQGAFDLLDEEITDCEIAYPSADVLEKTEMFMNLPQETNRLLDSLWIEVRGASNDNVWSFPVIFGSVVVLVVAVLIVKGKNKSKKSGQ